MQATDQLLISGLICIKHKKSTRNGLSVLFPGKGYTGRKAESGVTGNYVEIG